MYNLLAVYVSLLKLGFKKEDIIRVIKEISGAAVTNEEREYLMNLAIYL